MTYPTPYFRLANYSGQPDEDSPVGKCFYQYGAATRSIAGLDFPAAAAFPAVAPFDTLRIADGATGYWTFVFRPDVPNSIVLDWPNRTLILGIQAMTDAQVADQFAAAVQSVSVLTPGPQTSRFRAGAFVHADPLNRVTLEFLQIGVVGIIDALLVTAVGFNQISGLPGRGGLLAGRAYPVGWILPVAGALLVNGTDTIGITAANLAFPGGIISAVFEFSDDGTVNPGRTIIPFTAGDSPLVVANSIAAAINNPNPPPAGRGSTFAMRATVLPSVPIVYLQGTILGSVGGGIANPQLITETVADPGFVAFGMIGGQDGSIMAPLRWGLSRGNMPTVEGVELPQPE